MSHQDHDLDLIMALAEGSLSAPDAAAAQRQIDRCRECIEDLALQQAALAAFAATPSVALTDLEAARLKRDLDTALGHARTAEAPAPARKRGFNWVPVFSVAAVLLALVLVVPSLDLVSGGGDDDAGADAVALDITEEEDTSAATESAENRLRTEGAAGDGGGAAADDAAEAPAATTTTPAPAAAADEALPLSPEARELIDGLDTRLSASDSVDDARLKASLYGLTTADGADLDRCVPEGVEFFNVPGVDSYTLGDIDLDVGPVRVTAHPQRSDLGLAAHLDETCEIIATNES